MEMSKKMKTRKKLGMGTISLLLVAVGILFLFSLGTYGTFGDRFLRFIGLDPWSNDNTGLHYTVIYSLIFYIPATLIGHHFKNDWGAKVSIYR